MATARLYQRQGTYWVDLRQEGKPRERKSLGICDRREAEKLRRQEEARLILREMEEPEEPVAGPTFTEFYTRWLERVGSRLDPLTLAAYERACREAELVIGDRPLVSLRRADARRVVEAFAANGQQCRKRKRATVARLTAGVRACLADAVDAELTEINPFVRPGKLFDAVGLPSRELEDSEESRYYTGEEQRQLLDFARQQPDHSLFVATLLGLRAGLRRSEMLGLQRRDLGLKARYLHVRRRVTAGGDIGPPKSARSRRTVPMAKDLTSAIRAQLGKSEWVFASLRGGGVQDARRLGDRFQRMAQGAEVSSKKQPMHALRHSFASNLLTAGVPIFRVSRWLGHSSINVTTDIYGHLLSREGEHESIDQFSGVV